MLGGIPVPQEAPRLLSNVSSIANANERANLREAFTASRRADWNRARAFVARTDNRIARLIIEWRYLLDENGGASFDAIQRFLDEHPDWPRREALLARAEKAMPADMGPSLVVAWYDGRTPVTGTGMVRLGDALMATGRTAEGIDLIRKAWIEGSFTLTDELQILSAHSQFLTEADQRARLDMLLARDDVGAARRQASRVDGLTQRLAEARIRLRASPATVRDVLGSLPQSLREQPEILFEEARALRRRGQDADAWSVMLKAPLDNNAIVLPDRWWPERHVMTRDALKAGQQAIAYDLVSRHAIDSGAGFADAEFLAGWISLRFLNRSEAAAGHFRTLAQGVNLPISRARAYYWLGRAEEASNRIPEALAAYRMAAEYSETFYGQLALARIESPPVLRLRSVSPETTEEAVKAFEADERIQAIRLLSELDERDLRRLFVIRVANDQPDATKLQLLAELMLVLDDRAMSVRVAKIASYNGVVLPAYLDPVIPVPDLPGDIVRPEPALVLGLARQESEFDESAVSSAGARGLMQLMPATARHAAANLKLGYRQNDLTRSAQYNMQLGMATISSYLNQWGGSYVLAIASYNAGPGNVRRWVDTYGDPRSPGVDPIDWIELIPFSETRNYVQRVLENIEVYRNRLTGRDERLAILTDLYRPNVPKISVLQADPQQQAEASSASAVP